MKSSSHVFDKILASLRGDYNSVVYRFTVVPKEKVTLLLYRILGYSWIDFYSKRLDKFVLYNKKKIKTSYKYSGIESLEFLKKKGLKSNHKFLDFGCGFLRMGIVIIPFLQKGNYTGMDISRERIEAGKKQLKEKGIKSDNYNVYVNKNNLLLEIPKKLKFDFIYLDSVVTHMPLNDLRVLLKSFFLVLNNNGKIFFTCHIAEKFKIIGIKDFYYPMKTFVNISKEAGFTAELQNEWFEKKKSMIKLEKLDRIN